MSSDEGRKRMPGSSNGSPHSSSHTAELEGNFSEEHLAARLSVADRDMLVLRFSGCAPSAPRYGELFNAPTRSAEVS